MADNRPIAVGIVGLGRAGLGMHQKELAARKDKFQFVAACDTDPEARAKFAALEPQAKMYERIEDLLADPAVELVDIATRSCDHGRHAVAALKSGKQVFLEKPMTMDHAEAKRVFAASKKAKGKLYIRHNRRFEGAFNQVRDIIDSGVLGNVYQIKLARLSYNRRNDWQTILKYGGGQLLNWGPHIIDHALRLLGSPVKSIWSDLKCIAAAGDAEDHLKIILTGTKGRVVEVEISGGVALSAPQYIVWGARGALTCDGKTIHMKHLNPAVALAPIKANPGNPEGGFANRENLAWVEKDVEVQKMDLAQIWDHLYDALRKDKKFPIKDQEAEQVMWVVSQAKKGTKFAKKAKR